MNKKIISLISSIVMLVGLFIYMLVYTYFLNNNMDMCMNHYKDYNYCKTKVDD